MRHPQPFFRKSKNAWYVQIGRRQISLGKDKKAAWQRYYEIMAANEPLQADTTTLEMLFERYLDWVQENRKPGTYQTIRQHLSRCAKHLGKSTKVANLCGADLADWVETETTWNSTTRHDAIGSVIRAFNWAVEKRYLPSNPVAIVPNKPRRKRREVVYSPDDWKQIRDFVPDQAFGDFLDFMWETGCRPLEARTMESRHIRLDASIVIFPASEAKGERHERVIYLNEVATAIMPPANGAIPHRTDHAKPSWSALDQRRHWLPVPTHH